MMTITFHVDDVDEGLALMTFYQTSKRIRVIQQANDMSDSDAEKRLRSITLDDMIRNYGLTVVCANSLQSNGLTDAYSIGEAFVKDFGRSLQRIPNMGKKRLKDIELSLEKVGFFEFKRTEE